MDDKQVRKMVFEQELFKLIQHELITKEDYSKISYAHKRYYEEVELENSKLSKTEKKANKNNSRIPIASKPQKILSPQEIRERNISWILIIGVVLVLMSGLVLATSTWGMMSNIFKTILISLVAGLFFGISIVAGKLLKIQKTSFAFWVLGSLFLPVAVLSAGYFQLFGQYLSIFGEGKYLLGAVGASICLPVYLYSSKLYNNRLFVWISLITLSSDVAFLLASMNLKIDLFYFGIALYNGIILYAHNRLKNNEKIKLFTAEIPIFAQVNLILSTLFMMSFYENAVFYGFNILLIAALYILMVFAQGHKEYTFVFSGLVVYGIYQITENSFLSDIDLFIFAITGFVFAGVERYITREELIQKIFYYTNAVVSVLAFLYISLQGIFIRVNQSSWEMLFAYLAIALNYLYLSNRTSKKIFAYLTPIFLAFSTYQGYKLIQEYITADVESGVMFSAGTMIFVLLYFKNKLKYLQSIKKSSLLISLAVMTWGILSGFVEKQFILVAAEFVVMGLAFYIIYRLEVQVAVKQFCKFAVPSSWFIAVFILCIRIGIKINESSYYFEESYYFLAAVCITFGLGYLWQRYDITLKTPFYYVAHIVMPIDMLAILIEHPDEPYAFILIIGIYIYSMLACHDEWKKKVFLYASFVAGTITIYSLLAKLEEVIKFSQSYSLMEYTLLAGAIFIGAVWFFINNEWKERAAYYLIPFNILALYFLMFIYPFNYEALIFMLICISLEVYLLNYYKLQILQILPLWIFVIGLNRFIDTKLNQNTLAAIAVLVVSAFIVKMIGELLSNTLYGRNEEKKAIPIYFDWFVVTALILALQIVDRTNMYSNYSKWDNMIAPILIVYIIYSQIKRVPKGMPTSIAKTLAGFSLLAPYYTLIGESYAPFYKSTIYRLIETELYLSPWIVLVIVLSKKVWKGYEYITNKIEMGVLLIIAYILCKDLTGINQLTEGLILGVLSLASVIAGMQFKKKSFFFVGSGVLIFNMFVQTRDFWGSLPWWVYLLVAGMILIGIASLNEIQKNKKLIKIDKQALLDKFKGWN